MPLNPRKRWLSREEYLASEAIGKSRHEYLSGETYVLDEMNAQHQDIVQNVTTELQRQLREKTITYCKSR